MNQEQVAHSLQMIGWLLWKSDIPCPPDDIEGDTYRRIYMALCRYQREHPGVPSHEWDCQAVLEDADVIGILFHDVIRRATMSICECSSATVEHFPNGLNGE